MLLQMRAPVTFVPVPCPAPRRDHPGSPVAARLAGRCWLVAPAPGGGRDGPGCPVRQVTAHVSEGMLGDRQTDRWAA